MLTVIGLCYAELTPAIPVAGGEVAFAFKAFGSGPSFLTGWFLTFAYIALCPFEAVAIGWLIEYIIPELRSKSLYTIGGYPVSLLSITTGIILSLFIIKAKKEELKITDEQLKKIEDLVFSFEEKMIGMNNAASLQQLELRKLMQDRDNLDYEKIRAEFSKASESRHDMLIDRLKLRDAIQKILTPEQQEKLKALQEEGFRDRMPFFKRDGRHFPHRFMKFRDRIN